jgi:uncharacterized protein (TIRG00374 family)
MERKRIVLKFIQYSLVIVALAWIVSQTEWEKTTSLLTRIDLPVLVAVLFVTGLEFITRFSMLNALLNGRHRTRLFTAARINLVVKYVNNLLPSRAAGRSLVPFAIHHYTDHNWTESISIAGLGTGLHAILYGVVAVVGLAVFAGQLPHGILVVLGLSTALYITIGVAVLTAGRRLDAASGLAITASGRLIGLPVIGERLDGLLDRLPSFTRDATIVFKDLLSNPRVLSVYVLSWIGTLMLFPGIRVWLLLTGLGESFTPVVLIPVALVTAYSVTLLPLTPGGVGVAEASATMVFVALGVPEAVAVPIVLLDRFLGMYLPSLLGWFPMMELDVSKLLSGPDHSSEPPVTDE